MAFPTTISAFQHATASITVTRPFLSSAGNVYIIGRVSGTNIGAYKATDPSSSFSSVGTNPSSSVVSIIEAFQVGDVIHVVTAGATTVTSAVEYRYYVFSMSSDSWTNTGEQIAVSVDTGASSLAALHAGIVVRSDGDVIVFRHGGTQRVMGTDYTRVVYDRREGGTWTVGVAVDIGGELSFSPGAAVMGASDRAHFFFRNDTATRHRSLASDNTLGSSTANILNSCPNNDVNMGQTGTSYVSGSNTKICVAHPDDTANDATGHIATSSENPSFSLGATQSDMTGTTGTLIGGYVHSQAADDTTLWHAFVGSDGNIYTQSNADEAGWSTPASFLDETNGIERLKCNVYTRSGSVVLGIVFENNTDGIKYTEYTITASGPTGTANFTFGAMTTTSAGDVFVEADASPTFGAMTTTSDGDVAVVAESSFTFGAMTTTSDGDVFVEGDSNFTFDAMTVTSAGTVAFEERVADANFTFGAMTTTSDGDVFVDADSNFTFGAMTTTSDGDVAVVAESSFTFDAMTVTSAGTVGFAEILGDADFTFGAMTVTADGDVLVDADANFNFGAMTTTSATITFKTRLYLHILTNSEAGTFPSDSQATAPLIYDYTVADATVLKIMDTTKGTENPFSVKTGNSVASASPQVGFCGFYTSPPLDGNQTITNASLNINCAMYESNLAMNAGSDFTTEVYVWRPSTGTKVGTIHHDVTYNGVAEPTAAFSEQVNHGTSTSSTEVAALDGDVIIAEFFQAHTQDNPTSFQLAFYFDGGTVKIETGSAANSHASFIEFEPTYTFKPTAVGAVADFSFDTMGVSSTGDVFVVADSDYTYGTMTVTSAGTAGFTEIIGDADFTLGAMTTTSAGYTFKTRLYFTKNSSTLSGTLPFDTKATAPLAPPDYQVVTAPTLKQAELLPADNTASYTGGSDAVTSSQVGFYGMWTSRPLEGNQTILDSAININAAFQQSSLAMNLGAGFTAEIYVWRPSTGAKVGTVQHNVEYADDAENSGAAQLRVDHGTSTSSTEVSALDGDIIVCELFQVHSQDDAVSRSGTIQIGGSVVNIRTNASASSHAAFVEFVPLYTFKALEVTCNADFTFGAMTTASDGDVFLEGDANLSFAAMTVTSDGDVIIVTADGDFSFDAMTTTTEVDVLVVADSDTTFGAMTLTSDTDVAILADADITFGAMTTTTEVDVAVVAESNFTFGAMTLTADGVVSAFDVRVGDANFTYGTMTTTSDGDVFIVANSNTSFSDMTVVSSAVASIVASGNIAMGAMSTTSDGEVFVVGESNFTYGTMTISAAILGEAEMANLDKISLFASDYAPGTINDKLKKLLIANGATGTTLDDLWMDFLGDLGHTGTLNDRLRKFLLAYHAVSDTGQTVDDLWSLVTGPYVPA